MTILVVDDHAPFRTFMRMTLEVEGYQVVGEAGSGEEAVSAAESLGPDAVLLDVQLGEGIDGFEVARRINRLPHPPKLVMISSRDASTYESQLAEASVCGFIPKQDFSVEALASLLDEAPDA